MNSLVTMINGKALTTSLAIAEGVERPHKNILELIRNNLNDFEEFGGVAFKTSPFETRGGVQSREVAMLNEQQATLLMTFLRNIGIVKQFKVRLVKTFYELSKAKPMPQDLSRMDILKLAMQAEEEKLLLRNEVEELKPKADFYDQVSIAPDAISVAKAAKLIGTGRNRLVAYLKQIAWLTRHGEPYQNKIEQGYLEVKLGSWQHPDHGLQQSVTPLITGKGLVKIQQLRQLRANQQEALRTAS